MTTLSQWKARLAGLPNTMWFSKFPINPLTVFHITSKSFAFTNLKPVIPGHVLVSPIRIVDRFTNLTSEETEDLFLCAKLVGDALLYTHPHADSLTITIQDGKSAGQTVPHLHIHIMPRWKDDPFNLDRKGNDAIYQEIDKAEEKLGNRIDEIGLPRTADCMITEAQNLRESLEYLLSKSG